MATILAHIKVHAGKEQQFEDLAKALYQGTHEHETGVASYQYWRGAEPSTYYTLLSFADHRAFIVHQVSDHHEDASPKLGEVIEDMSLEWVDPVQGASPWPATDHQDAPADADELTTKYTKRFAAQVADWWSTQR